MCKKAEAAMRGWGGRAGGLEVRQGCFGDENALPPIPVAVQNLKFKPTRTVCVSALTLPNVPLFVPKSI